MGFQMELAAVRASRGLSHHTTTKIAWEIHFRAPGPLFDNGFSEWVRVLAPSYGRQPH